MRAGCDVGIKDCNGLTGWQMAEGLGHAAVAERLRAVVAEQLRAAPADFPAPKPAGGEAEVEQAKAALPPAAQLSQGPRVMHKGPAGQPPAGLLATESLFQSCPRPPGAVKRL